MTRLTLAIALSALALTPDVAWAHGSLAERSAHVDHALEARPGDREALLSRAELDLEAGSPERAIVDLENARRLAGDCPRAARRSGGLCLAVELLLAEAYAAAGDGPSADEVLARVLGESPAEPRALYLRARAAAADARYGDAARDLESSLAATSEPAASAYVELAGLHVADGSDDLAMRVLESAAQRLGPLVVLIDPAIDIEVRRGRFAEALSWTDRWEPRMLASPAGRAARAELLVGLGRAKEAEAEAHLGLEVIAALPRARRSSLAIVAVEARLQATMTAARESVAHPAPAESPPGLRPWGLIAGLAALLLLTASGLRRSGSGRRRLEAR